MLESVSVLAGADGSVEVVSGSPALRPRCGLVTPARFFGPNCSSWTGVRATRMGLHLDSNAGRTRVPTGAVAPDELSIRDGRSALGGPESGTGGQPVGRRSTHGAP